MKKCSVCRTPFAPKYSSLQKTCSTSCAIEFGKLETEKKAKIDWSREKKERKEKLMTASDYRQLLQTVFNTFIRMRDEGKPCVSCDRPLTGKFDAGHFYSVGSYPNLRYDEMNVHGQCVHCNRDKHGNHAEYALRIESRIGPEALTRLTENRNSKLHLSIPEIQELMVKYKLKIKQLKNEK